MLYPEPDNSVELVAVFPAVVDIRGQKHHRCPGELQELQGGAPGPRADAGAQARPSSPQEYAASTNLVQHYYPTGAVTEPH